MSDLARKELPVRPEIDCPSCGSAIDLTEHQDEVTCIVCSGDFVLAGHLCPACNRYHVEERAACSACGTALVRMCRQCQTANWTGDESCIRCGQGIDLLSQLEAQLGQTTPDRLSQQMSAAKELNRAESDASDRRMAELMAIEEARQADVRRQRARRERQERNMLIVVFAAVLLFLLLLVGFAILSSLG